MNLTDAKYTPFALVREMFETADVIRNFDMDATAEIAEVTKKSGKMFLTGEGSSRIFPAKNAVTRSLAWGMPIQLVTEGAWQAKEYPLEGWTVFGVSNSGETKEIVSLMKDLQGKEGVTRVGVTANEDTTLEKNVDFSHVLSCGKEDAVAATKSVVEQALVYLSVLRNIRNCPECNCPLHLGKLADAATEVMSREYDASVIQPFVEAPLAFFAGRNNGVAEELTLKTNEICRKKSDFLEGTYCLHGIEEVMDSDEVLVLIEPFKEEIDAYDKVLAKSTGIKIVAISTFETPFPTVLTPNLGALTPVLQLMAGWNLLVQAGVELSIDLDKPERARKVGNQFVE